MLQRAAISLDNGLWCFGNFHETSLAWDSTRCNTMGTGDLTTHAVVRSLIGALSPSLYEDSIFLSYPYIFEKASPVVKFDMIFQKFFCVSWPSSCCLLYPDIPPLSPPNPSILVPTLLNSTLFYLPFHGGSLPPPGPITVTQPLWLFGLKHLSKA